MIPVHIPSAFRVGQRVIVTTKVPEANFWADKWNDVDMDRTLGQTGNIVNASPTGGFQVQIENSRDAFWYPSCALLPVNSAPVQKNVRPPKRVRVGEGPWNAAPCPHLRWNLMGFFREKLAIEKTSLSYFKPDGTAVANELAEVSIECPKCSKKMFLRAANLATAKK